MGWLATNITLCKQAQANKYPWSLKTRRLKKIDHGILFVSKNYGDDKLVMRV